MSRRKPLMPILPLLEGEVGALRLKRFWAKVDKRGPDDCWEWRGTRKADGYGRFRAAHSPPVVASRFALISTTRDEPAGMIVLHRCDNPPCCNPAHLLFGTLKDNVDDMVERGRHPKAGTKLSEEQVALVVERLKAGWTNSEIAADLPVRMETISQIRTGRNWGTTTAAMGWVPTPLRNRRWFKRPTDAHAT